MADDISIAECGCEWHYNDDAPCILIPCEVHRKKYGLENAPRELSVANINYAKQIHQILEEVWPIG